MFKDAKSEIFLAIHVDDGILISKDISKMKKLLKQLNEEFEMTIIENPEVCLNSIRKKTRRTLHTSRELCQQNPCQI